MTKPIGVIGTVLLVVAIVLSATAATSASATRYCAKTEIAGEGNFPTQACTGNVGALGNFVLADVLHSVTINRLCAHAFPNQFLLKWSDRLCSSPAMPVDTGAYAAVNLALGSRPTVKTSLPGETYPVVVGGSAKATGEENSLSLQSELANLPASEVTVLFTFEESSPAQGMADLTFSGVHEHGSSAHKCNSEGAGEGVVAVNGEVSLVYTNFTSLEPAALVLFEPFLISCNKGALEIELNPSLLAKIPPPAGGDITSFDLTAHCHASGVQELSSYYFESQLPVTQLLEVETGGIVATACEEVAETILLGVTTESKAKMFTILY